jgi:predicted DNA-binding transcriptional regulator AlpA
MGGGDRLLTINEVMARAGYKSRSSVYRAIQAGEMPPPRRRRGQSVWVESEVQAAIDEQIRTLPRMGQSMGRGRVAA